MMKHRRWRAFAAVVAGVCSGVLGSGCGAALRDGGRNGLVIPRGEPPAYESAAAAYNARIGPLRSLFASTVVRVTYIDADGQRRTEQGEGLVQVRVPHELALSVNKAGRRLFWLGCDANRYWWFDLVDGRRAYIGRHAEFRPGRESAAGIGIHPLDVIAVLGIVPLPTGSWEGATQWSQDGRLLGLTTRGTADGYQRIWVDPETYQPRLVELFTPEQSLVMVARLEQDAHVQVTGVGALGPRVAMQVLATHIPSGTDLRLTMSDAEDGARRISSRAFEFSSLTELLQPEQITDVDLIPR